MLNNNLFPHKQVSVKLLAAYLFTFDMNIALSALKLAKGVLFVAARMEVELLWR